MSPINGKSICLEKFSYTLVKFPDKIGTAKSIKTSNILEFFTQRSRKGDTGPAISCPVALRSPNADQNTPKDGCLMPA